MIVNENAFTIQYINLYSLIEYKIGIPIFQRFYAWNSQKTSDILKDIDEFNLNEDKDFYLLDFICYIEDENIMIADGQQRLITINLLLKAINDIIDENGLNIQKCKLFNIYYEIEKYNEIYSKCFNNFICGPFKKVYIYLKNRMNARINKIDEIITIIKNKIYIYKKDCSNADDAFNIFEQINTGGKPLTKDDIVKTAIEQYSHIYNLNISINADELKRSIFSYYKYLTNSSVESFDNIALLGFLKKQIGKDRDSFSKFYNVSNLLSQERDYPIMGIFKYIHRVSLKSVVDIICMKRINLNDHFEYLSKIIIPLIMISVVFSIKKVNPSVLNTLSSSVIQNLNNGVSCNDIYYKIIEYVNENSASCKINFEDFEKYIGGDNNDNHAPDIKKALLLLDIILSNRSGIINIHRINLEHIYPQSPSIEWASNGWPTAREEQKKIINNIGNQFILSETVNKSIGNKYISKKKERYIQALVNDRILNTEINNLDFDSFEHDKVDYVIKRQKKIAKYIKENYPLGQVLIN